MKYFAEATVAQYCARWIGRPCHVGRILGAIFWPQKGDANRCQSLSNASMRVQQRWVSLAKKTKPTPICRSAMLCDAMRCCKGWHSSVPKVWIQVAQYSPLNLWSREITRSYCNASAKAAVWFEVSRHFCTISFALPILTQACCFPPPRKHTGQQKNKNIKNYHHVTWKRTPQLTR